MSAGTTGYRVVYAGFWRRGAAYVIDWSLLSLVACFPLLAGGGGLEVAAWIIFAAFCIFYLAGLAGEGGTPGKRLLGMRLVRPDGSPPGFMRGLGRELLRSVTYVPLGIGWLWMLDERAHRTWHDLAADTIVVREVRDHEGPAWSESPPWADDGSSTPRAAAPRPQMLEPLTPTTASTAPVPAADSPVTPASSWPPEGHEPAPAPPPPADET